MTKKLLGAVLMTALGTTMLFVQSGMMSGADTATEHEIQKLETSLWQAWKNHEAKPFEEHLTSDSVNVVASTSRGKANIVKDITSQNCKVSSFSLSGFGYQWLDARSVIVTYVATQDAVCDGQKAPAKVNASSVWVKRGKKWMNAFHQESPVM
jgi:hypothetical protein